MPSSIGVDIVLGLGALATLVSLVRSWRSFWDDHITQADRLLAMQISVFLVPPVIVLIHELGHAVATWMVGASVEEFRYGLFEGSVTAVGFITPTQSWFIAVAGNAVSIVAGFAMVLVGDRARGLRRPLRYVLILAGAVELLFALVAYPLLSMSTSAGDWVQIYDFSATPVLAGVTLAVHVAMLAGLWHWWRSSLRRTLFAMAHGEEGRLAALTKAVEDAPDDVDTRLRLADLFARNGDLGQAADALDAAARELRSPRLQLARARLALHRGRWNDAVVAARAGVAASDGGDTDGDGELRQRLWANEGLALAQMERPANAVAAFEHVGPPVIDDLQVRYGRGVARLGAGDTDGGQDDLRVVIERSAPGTPLRDWAETRLKGETPPITPMSGV